MGGASGILAHGGLLETVTIEPGLPFRMKRLGGLGLHPAREAFVEPDVVPPRHGDEVAEPLMRHLVGDDAEDAAACIARAGGRIEQQSALEERDAAPVLHGAAETSRHRDQVELGQRIGDAEIIVEVAQQTACGVERITSVHALAPRRHHPDGDTADIGSGALQVARREHEKIARHARRRLKRNALLAVADRLLLSDRHVGHCEKRLRHRYGEGNARLEGGLVPAWKDAARIGGFQMGRDHPLAALRSRIIDHEKPSAEAVDTAREGQAQRMAASRNRAREGERHGLRRRVERYLRPGLVVNRRRVDRHVDRVEHQVRGRLRHLDVDHLGSCKAELVEIRCKIERVVGRHHGFRQLAGRRIKRKNRFSRDATRHRRQEGHGEARQG